MPSSIQIRVECYAGYKGEERPVRFWMGDNCIEVEEVEGRWYSPGASFFRVIARGGDRYMLKCVEGQETWELEAFRAANSASAALT